MPASQEITVESVVRQSSDQVSSDVEGDVAIMSVDKGNYYMLNEVGARFWQLIEEPCRVGDACLRLLDEYDTGRDKCEDEILRLVRELVEQELVEVVDATRT
jgi:hypothetical protein